MIARRSGQQPQGTGQHYFAMVFTTGFTDELVVPVGNITPVGGGGGSFGWL